MTETLTHSNTLFPVFLKLEQLHTLIVGGGKVGLEKLNALLANSPEAEVVVVAEEFLPELKTLVALHPGVTLVERAFKADDVLGMDLVIAATDDKEVNAQVRERSKANKILVNVADTPALCDFYLSSIVQKGSLKLGISTNGKSPTIAKRLKQVLDEAIPLHINDSLDNLEKVRSNLNGNFAYKVQRLNEITSVLVTQGTVTKPSERKWEKLLTGSLAFIGAFVLAYIVFYFLPPQVIEGWVVELVGSLDEKILYAALGGFIAQIIDGALGMAYGLSATTILMSFGVPPAATSASVHTSEIFTSGVSGLSHLRFGNVNTKLFKTLLLPGVVGAIAGSYILSSLEAYTQYLKPVISIYTLILGLVIIRKALKKPAQQKKIRKIAPLAAFGGLMDAMGGGGWGPIVSSTLIAGGRNARYTIGSVNLTEFFVALASSLTFISLIGLSHWQIIAGLVIGGSFAAPIAARLSSKLPTKTIMILVGIIVIIVSIRIIVLSFKI